MSQQQQHALRQEYEAIIPSRMRSLPVDHRGFPVPWFIRIEPGKETDFRIADPQRWEEAITRKRCWVCGGQLGIYLTFVIGPMCMVNRITSEPPCHADCAEFSARACPFLSIPAKGYREKNLPEAVRAPAGTPLFHNPTATVLWTSRGFSVFPAPGGYLIGLEDPVGLSFWHRGKPATRAEVLAAIDVGLPKVRAVAIEEGRGALDRFEGQLRAALALLPPEESAA